MARTVLHGTFERSSGVPRYPPKVLLESAERSEERVLRRRVARKPLMWLASYPAQGRCGARLRITDAVPAQDQ